LVADGIDRFEGQAFITEYAQPSSQLSVIDPLLQELRQRYPYVTRLYGQMSPDEMTVDPVFDFNNNLADISNIRDLTSRTDLYPCQDDDTVTQTPVPIIDNGDDDQGNTEVPIIGNNDTAETNFAIPELLIGAIAATCLIGIGVAIGGGIIFLARRK